MSCSHSLYCTDIATCRNKLFVENVDLKAMAKFVRNSIKQAESFQPIYKRTNKKAYLKNKYMIANAKIWLAVLTLKIGKTSATP